MKFLVNILQADGGKYPANNNIKLCDNYIPFYSIEVITNFVQVDEFDNVFLLTIMDQQ